MDIFSLSILLVRLPDSSVLRRENISRGMRWSQSYSAALFLHALLPTRRAVAQGSVAWHNDWHLRSVAENSSGWQPCSPGWHWNWECGPRQSGRYCPRPLLVESSGSAGALHLGLCAWLLLCICEQLCCRGRRFQRAASGCDEHISSLDSSSNGPCCLWRLKPKLWIHLTMGWFKFN